MNIIKAYAPSSIHAREKLNFSTTFQILFFKQHKCTTPCWSAISTQRQDNSETVVGNYNLERTMNVRKQTFRFSRRKPTQMLWISSQESSTPKMDMKLFWGRHKKPDGLFNHGQKTKMLQYSIDYQLEATTRWWDQQTITNTLKNCHNMTIKQLNEVIIQSLKKLRKKLPQNRKKQVKLVKTQEKKWN